MSDHCDHSKDYNQVSINTNFYYSCNPLTEAADSACIHCISKHIDCLNYIEDVPRNQIPLTCLEVTHTIILQNISYNKIVSTQAKFEAMIWCLERGFRCASDIFEFTYPFTANQLAQLTKFAVFPHNNNLKRYIDDNKWDELKAIHLNLPELYLEYSGVWTDTKVYRESLGVLIYKHELPGLVYEVLHFNKIMNSDEFVPKAIIDNLILPLLL